MSDPQLTVCPSCGKESFKKQLTAAGFQLKGTGWYATDFRGGKPPPTGVASGPAEGGGKSEAPKSDAGAAKADAPKADASAPAKPASGTGTA